MQKDYKNNNKIWWGPVGEGDIFSSVSGLFEVVLGSGQTQKEGLICHKRVAHPLNDQKLSGSVGNEES